MNKTTDEIEKLTEILQFWNDAPEETLNKVFIVSYGEIRKLAKKELRKLNISRFDDNFHTTMLVHEVFPKLREKKSFDFTGLHRASFFAYCQLCMRSILIDYLRKKSTQNETSTDYSELPVTGFISQKLDEDALAKFKKENDLAELQLALETAVRKLYEKNPLHMKIIVLKYWNESTYQEIADFLQLSEPKVRRIETEARALIRNILKNNVGDIS